MNICSRCHKEIIPDESSDFQNYDWEIYDIEKFRDHSPTFCKGCSAEFRKVLYDFMGWQLEE